ncbi:hypothetical protein ATO67_19115 [Agrobacterium bohemicum]|uniref:Uncharacterized protein n=1 Tax=Agrobacterium bohemicum TaxID=2052828 RepID=A0A135P7M2_9HYPH|nr:hypothetical protein ATO67_19115 [Agrobacterium bohemicum]
MLLLYDAGAESVPAHAIAWRAYMTPAINVGMNMGYMRYRERDGVRHFYLTDAGYNKMGIPPFPAWAFHSYMDENLSAPRPDAE